MEFIGIPEETVPSSRARIGDRALGLWAGVRWVVGGALVIDAFRGGWILNVLLRWPGGGELPAFLGLVLAASFFIRRPWASVVPALGAIISLVNIVEYYLLLATGLPAAGLPFSILPLVLFVIETIRPRRRRPVSTSWKWAIPGAVATGPALALLHLFTFGATDYTRPAEAIVVFGARAYADGRPSLALWDRVQHGIRLYQEGVAPVLVISGSGHEVKTMKRLALEAGVPAEAIEEDPAGLNTASTVANLKYRRVVVVSHYYHLARIKLVAGRSGVECYTAPCRMSRRLAKEPYFIFRECAALGAYYLLRG